MTKRPIEMTLAIKLAAFPQNLLTPMMSLTKA